MARGIMRKSGFRPGTTPSSSAAPILSLYGSRRVCFTPGFVRNTEQTDWGVVRDALYVWGLAGQRAALPEGQIPPWFLEPTRHPLTQSGIIDLAGNSSSTVYVKSDGSVYAGGHLDGVQPTPAFHLQSGLSGIVQVASHRIDFTGDALYFLKNDGTVWGMGQRMAGMGTFSAPYGVAYHWTEDIWTPSQMPTDKVSDVVEISAEGLGLLFRTSDDTVGLWRNQQEFPVETPAPGGGASPIAKMRGGFSHTLILTEDGKIWATGENSFGQFGNGTFTQDTPRASWHQAIGTGYTDVDAATFVSLAVSGSQLYTWGGGGALAGRGPAATTTHTPTAITTPDMSDTASVWGGPQAVTAFASKENGCVYAWGNNIRGGLGQGYLGGESSVPVQVLFSEAYPILQTIP